MAGIGPDEFKQSNHNLMRDREYTAYILKFKATKMCVVFLCLVSCLFIYKYSYTLIMPRWWSLMCNWYTVWYCCWLLFWKEFLVLYKAEKTLCAAGLCVCSLFQEVMRRLHQKMLVVYKKRMWCTRKYIHMICVLYLQRHVPVI